MYRGGEYRGRSCGTQIVTDRGHTRYGTGLRRRRKNLFILFNFSNFRLLSETRWSVSKVRGLLRHFISCTRLRIKVWCQYKTTTHCMSCLVIKYVFHRYYNVTRKGRKELSKIQLKSIESRNWAEPRLKLVSISERQSSSLTVLEVRTRNSLATFAEEAWRSNGESLFHISNKNTRGDARCQPLDGFEN